MNVYGQALIKRWEVVVSSTPSCRPRAPVKSEVETCITKLVERETYTSDLIELASRSLSAIPFDLSHSSAPAPATPSPALLEKDCHTFRDETRSRSIAPEAGSLWVGVGREETEEDKVDHPT